jgi:predicted amidohydrolase YtcJ
MAQGLAGPVFKQRPDLGGDLAIVNGRIWTMDPAKPRAQAALIRAGRIVMVGSNAEVQAQARGVRRMDAGGRTVVPGFIDSHTHLEIASYYYAGLQADVHSPPMMNVPQVLDTLRALAARTEPGRWVIGRGSFGAQNTFTEKRFPTREELDSVSTRHPVVFMGGFHGWSMNTLAFQKLRLWDPAEARELRWRDGRRKVGTDVARDAQGRPTGVVTEIFDLIPNDAHTYAEKREALRTQVVPNFSAKGITSTSTIPLFDDDMLVIQELQAQGQLPMRVRYYPTVPAMISLESVRQFALSPGFGDDMLRFGGIKIFVAGAGYDAQFKPVTDIKWTQDELDDIVWRAHSQGLQILLHQAGASLKNTLEAVEKAQARMPFDLRHRLEHYSTLTPEEMVRMRRLGMKVAITAPAGRGARPAGWASQPVPRYRTMIEQGLEPVAISDATGTVPVFSPMIGIGGMVASPQEGGSAPVGQSPDLEDAIRMFTLWAARSTFEENAKGSITPGKLGDFAILDRDLAGAKATDLFDVKVDATVLGGRTVFER